MTVASHLAQLARVAKLADARDLKSIPGQPAPKRTVAHNCATPTSDMAFQELGDRSIAHGCAPNPKRKCHQKCHQENVSDVLRASPLLSEKNGFSRRARTYNPPVNSRKEAISSNCCQLLLMPKNQWFLVGRFVSDYYLLLLITVQGPRYFPRV